MKLKKVIGLAAVALSVVTLAACSSKSDSKSSAKDDKTVTVWAWDESFNVKAVNEAKKFYEDKDIEVKVSVMSQDDIVQKLNTSFASGSKEGLPNIVLIEDYRVQSFLTAYEKSFSPLDDIVSEDDFSSYKFAVNKVGDKIYGVPFDSGVTGLFYRRDLLSEAGYSAEDLENITWEEYIKIGKDVKAKTGKALQFLDPSDLGLVRIIMQSAGAWYQGQDGKEVTIKDNDALKYGIKIYSELLKSGVVEQVSSWDAGVSAVQTGTSAAIPTGCWYSSSIQGGEEFSGKWGVAPIPTIKGSDAHASSSGGSGWYLLKGISGEDKAKDFLKATFASNVDFMDDLAKEIGLVSTLNAAKEAPTYKEGVAYYDNQKVFEDFSKWSGEVPQVNYGQNTYAIETVMAEYVQRVLDGEDIDKVLKEAQTQVEAQVAN
ncbi:ABC transporter substrate-binding protein [Lactococcus hodotermopsidis]|uniref:ABC transporter substrate-binding protein n=1 Tax=Pseudolactococcus hodotermopsidis TaxID=2709157 RepID=A0A6A0BBL0_9LACT|nr:extracellular solute-binding protein [Lactococcus hodotermopsidis]GFH42722.1 ABC transporter substrate-binding protein [Lactococcus hodotermopsidis]